MKKDGLAARVISAVILAPPVIAAFYFGKPYFDILAVLIALLMAWEWTRLVGGGEFGFPGFCLAGVVSANLGLFYFHSLEVAAAVSLVGGLVLYALFFIKNKGLAFWLAIGSPYISLPILSLIWIRQDPELGLELIFWLIFVVWATDIGAYVFGRLIGGPKVLPSVSPKKTWAGVIGGMIWAGAIGYVASFVLPVENLIVFIAISAVLAVIAQVGDFFESGVKRKFDVKDSSNLIPGHGGILDRVDGLLTVALVAGALLFLEVEFIS